MLILLLAAVITSSTAAGGLNETSAPRALERVPRQSEDDVAEKIYFLLNEGEKRSFVKKCSQSSF